MGEQGKRAEIYTHESANLVYAMNWSVSSCLGTEAGGWQSCDLRVFPTLLGLGGLCGSSSAAACTGEWRDAAVASGAAAGAAAYSQHCLCCQLPLPPAVEVGGGLALPAAANPRPFSPLRLQVRRDKPFRLAGMQPCPPS